MPHPFHPLSRPSPPALAILALGLAVLVLRPPVFPAIGDAWSLLELRGEAGKLRGKREALRLENAALRSRIGVLRGKDPFLQERAAREAGLLKPKEFDYRAVAQALALPPCPPRRLSPQ